MTNIQLQHCISPIIFMHFIQPFLQIVARMKTVEGRASRDQTSHCSLNKRLYLSTEICIRISPLPCIKSAIFSSV